jgi:predicted ATPase
MDFIEIKGYKSIKDAKIELRPINILIGANGSGKTNFLSFFEFLNNLLQQKLNEYVALNGGEDKFLYHGKKITDEISFEISFENNKNGYFAIIKSGINNFVFMLEHLIYQSDKGSNINKFSAAEANVKTTDHFRAKYVKKYLDNIKKYHFHDTSKNSPFSKTSHIENDIFNLYSDGANLAAFLWHIKETQPVIYQRIISTIQSVAPYFSDFNLIPNENNFIRLRWQDKFSENNYGVNDLSDGTIRFIALTVLFMQPNLPETIIIDEPELGLHPFAIAKLAGLIKMAAAKGCQVIAATQSIELLNYFEPNDVITVDSRNGESYFERLENEKLAAWLENYTLGELWKNNFINKAQPNY